MKTDKKPYFYVSELSAMLTLGWIMKKKKALIYSAMQFLISTFFFMNSAHALEVNGEVSGHWTLNDSPVHVIGNVTVPEGEELTIDPGVTVMFARDTWFSIRGLITAIGTEEDSIVFTADTDEPEHGFWSWISISRSGEGSLTYCIMVLPVSEYV